MEYKVGVSLEILGIAAGLAALRQFTASMQHLQARVQSLNRSVQTMRTDLMALGAGMAGVGVGLAVGLVKAGDAAARYQNTLSIIRTSTRATTEEIGALSQAIQEHALRSSLSYQQAADLARGLAQAGVPLPALTYLMRQQDVYAAGRVLSIYGKVPSYFEAGRELAAIPHQLGVYGRTPQEQQLLMDIIRRTVLAETVSPAMLASIVRVASYVLPFSAQVLRADPRIVYDMLIASLQASGGSAAGRAGAISGAAWRALFTRIFPGVFGGGLLTGTSAPALAALGFTRVADIRSAVYKQVGGQFVLDPMKLLSVLERSFVRAQTLAGQQQMITAAWQTAIAEGNRSALKKLAPVYADVMRTRTQLEPGNFLTRLLMYALGSTGATLAAIVATPGFRQALGNIEAQTRAFTPQQIVQQRQQQVYQEQLVRLHAALQSLAITAGQYVLPALTRVVTTLTSWIQVLNTFLARHPAVAKMLATFAEIASVALMVGGGLLMFSAVLGALATPVGLVTAGVLALAAVIVRYWPQIHGAMTAMWADATRIWSQIEQTIRSVFDRILQFVRRLVPFLPLPAPTPAPGPAVPHGYRAVPALGGGVAGMQRVGPHGMGVGPLLPLPGPAQSAPGLQYLTRPGTAPPHPATGGLVVHGGIHLTVHGAPGSDHQSLARQLVTAFVDELQHVGIATSVGQGTRESPHLAGVPV
jgi:hypothetical protein